MQLNDRSPRHIDIMDALHTIGRNIAQHDAIRMRQVHALESIKVAMWTIAAWVVVMAVMVGIMANKAVA